MLGYQTAEEITDVMGEPTAAQPKTLSLRDVIDTEPTPEDDGDDAELPTVPGTMFPASPDVDTAALKR